MIGRTDYVLLREVADRLAAQPDLLCALDVSLDHGRLTVTMTVPASLDVIELGQELAYLAGVGAVRAFAAQYGIPPEELDPFINRTLKEKTDAAHSLPLIAG